MKKNTMSVVLASALLAMTAAHASEFTGGYVGADVGRDNSSAVSQSGSTANAKAGSVYLPSASATGLGLSAGYNWDINNIVLGVDGFYNQDSSTTHNLNSTNFASKVYGLDAKLGLPYGKWMPFVKLGADHTASTNDLNPQAGRGVHSAVGLEYKFAPHWSAQAQYEVANAKTDPGKIANKTTSIGVNYYFDSPYVAPVVAAIAAPIVVKQAKPVIAPVPAPTPVVVAPAPTTIFTDKPVTIEGASFDTNSAKLKPAADKKLNEVVEFAAKNKDAKLTVQGYTDSRGKEKANHVLSTKRAEAVKAYLVKKGVAADRIIAEGKGSAKPIGDNKTKAGQAENRRVEIDSMVRSAK